MESATDVELTKTELPAIASPRMHRSNQLAVIEQAENAVNEAELSAVITTRTQHTYGGGPFKVEMASTHQSFRCREAIICSGVDAPLPKAVWVNVRSTMTLQTALNKYGANLLAYEAVQKEVAAEVLGFDVMDSSQRSVSVLVRAGT